MHASRRALLSVLIGLSCPVTAFAQDANALRSELMSHFDLSMNKVIALAEAMPADKYQWKPGADAMPVGHVYAHIANYNFYYPATAMGVTTPADIKADTLEAMRDKAQIVALLRRSAEHVRKSIAAMPAAQLSANTRLYGRTVPQWAVLLQLVAHMNEHLGQSIAYARANDVVPPWSR
ncbi:MAG TPA: DinB family protein [Gemmatimonadaceae bacterium]|nr:DinB family protein [Gemmatimonadaceae bacterium]